MIKSAITTIGKACILGREARKQMRRSQRRVPSLNLSTRPRNLQNASNIQQIWEFKFRHIPPPGTVRAWAVYHSPERSSLARVTP